MMRRVLLLIAAAMLLHSCAAEEARSVLQGADLSPLTSFAREYAGEVDVAKTAEEVLDKGMNLRALAGLLRQKAAAPLKEVLSFGLQMLAPMALLAVTGCTLRGGGARFLLRISLLLALTRAAGAALAASEKCLRMAASFSDAAAPVLSALMAATGMANSAAILSPAAAMAGNIVQDGFLQWGIPLCRAALCISAAGSLSDGMDLSRAAKLVKKAVALGVGLAFTLFTALIALQGSVTANLDGLAARTAKYAVDSAAPVIGSGVSDAWDSYVAGVMAAKGAVGVSGVIVLAAAGISPLVCCGGAMALMQACAAFLEAVGEKTAARASAQAADVCQMALQLSSGALAIGMILLGAAIRFGGSVMG